MTDRTRSSSWTRRSLQRRMALAVSIPFLAVVVLTAVTFLVRQHTLEVRAASITALENELAVEQLLTSAQDAHLAAASYARDPAPSWRAEFDQAVGRRTEVSDRLGDGLSAGRNEEIDSVLREHHRALLPLIGAGLSDGERRQRLSTAATERAELVSVLRRTALEESERFRTNRETADTLNAWISLAGVLIGVVGAVGGFAALWFLYRGVAARLRRLQVNAQRLATGEALLPEAGGNDEIAELARTIEGAHATIREKDELIDLTLETGGMVIFESRPGDEITMRGEPALLQAAGFSGSTVTTTLSSLREHLDVADDTVLTRLPNGDLRLRMPDGQERWLEVRSREQPLNDGTEAMGVVGVISDVTARVQAQEALQDAKDRAEQASRFKDDFLSRMSHELRTPLNAVLGFAQLLDMDDLEPEQREGVGHILKGGRHLLALVNDVLDLARVESGRLSLSVEPTRLVDVVEEAVRLTSPLAHEHRIELRVPGQHSDAHALVDRRRLKQVLLNLLTNGIKYNRPGGSVSVDWSLGHGKVRISVSDTGIGIDDKQLTDLFLPFARSDERTTDIEGTGLGLAVSRSLVEAMSGTMTLADTGPAGSRFLIELPEAEVRSGAGTVEDPTQTAAEDLRALGPLSVLHVEDNAANRRLVEELLLRVGCSSPVSTSHGQDALALARAQGPDLVLLDRHLPDMLGEDVLRELRADERTAGIPVIVVSADVMTRSASVLRRSGADAFVTKPIEAEEFWRTVTNVMRQRGGTS